VGVGDALRRPGAARGEEDRRRARRLGRGQSDRRLGLQQRLEAVPGSRLRATVGDDPPRQLADEPAGAEILPPLFVSEQRRGPADLERVVDLAERVAIVERRGD
jgi:hypothetical protein